jgi:hypothetical protein
LRGLCTPVPVFSSSPYLLDCVLHVLSGTVEAKSGLVFLLVPSLWWNENETNELQPGLLAEFVVPQSIDPGSQQIHKAIRFVSHEL